MPSLNKRDNMEMSKLGRYDQMTLIERFKLAWCIISGKLRRPHKPGHERIWGREVDSVVLVKNNCGEVLPIGVDLPRGAIDINGLTSLGIMTLYHNVTTDIPTVSAWIDIDGDVLDVEVNGQVVGKFFISASTGYCEFINL